MARARSTTVEGKKFDAATVEEVWKKATGGLSALTDMLRLTTKDRCGATIKRDAYGTTGEYGWEIDHIKPVAKGGSDDLANLQPLHWENNNHKSDNWPNWSCKKKS